MKRTIKFRGKRIDNGEWVHGDLIHICGGCVIYHGSSTESELMEDSSNLAIGLYMNEASPVVTNTVGQFTGLKDMGGRDAYEGDIVRFQYKRLDFSPACEHKMLTLTGEVTSDEYGRTVINVGGNGYHICNVDNGTVIGNVHDNPDLLKGGTL